MEITSAYVREFWCTLTLHKAYRNQKVLDFVLSFIENLMQQVVEIVSFRFYPLRSYQGVCWDNQKNSTLWSDCAGCCRSLMQEPNKIQ